MNRPFLRTLESESLSYWYGNYFVFSEQPIDNPLTWQVKLISQYCQRLNNMASRKLLDWCGASWVSSWSKSCLLLQIFLWLVLFWITHSPEVLSKKMNVSYSFSSIGLAPWNRKCRYCLHVEVFNQNVWSCRQNWMEFFSTYFGDTCVLFDIDLV